MARDARVPGAHYSIVAFSGYFLSEQILIFRPISQAQHEDSLRSIPEKIVLFISPRQLLHGAGAKVGWCGKQNSISTAH